MRFGGRQSGVDAMCQASTGLSEIYVQAISTRKLHFPAPPHQSYCHVGYGNKPAKKELLSCAQIFNKEQLPCTAFPLQPACIKELHMA